MKDTVLDVAIWFLVLPLRVLDEMKERSRLHAEWREEERRRSQRA